MLAIAANSRVAFRHRERVGVLIFRFSKLNSPAYRYPCLRFERHLAMPPARLGAKMESLSPFSWDSYIPYNMPVDPGAPRLTGYRPSQIAFAKRNAYPRQTKVECPDCRTNWRNVVHFS